MSTKPRILIVDDHPTNRRLPAKLLSIWGWVCDQAADGEAALARLAIAQYDAVLLDLSMPGISGYEVCHRIRTDAALKSMRIIAYTSMSSSEDVIRAAGFDGLINKPLVPKKLFALLETPQPGSTEP